MRSDKLSKPIGKFNSTLGEIVVYNLRIRDKISIEDSLKKPVTELDPEIYIRELLRNVCHKKSILKKEEDRPQKVTLTKREVNKLREDELNLFCNKFLEHNDYLYRETISDKREQDKFNEIIVSKGELEYPQKDDESSIQYLHRLMCISYEKMIAPFTKFINSKVNFSQELQNNIRKNLLMGDSLKKLSSINFGLASRGPKINFIEEVESKIGLNPPESMLKTNIPTFYESNTEPIINEIDRLSEVTAKSVEFQNNANINMINVASEIKGASDKAVDSSKRNWKLSIGILVLSLASLLMGGYGIISSNNSKAEDSSTMIKELQNIGSSISSQSAYMIMYETRLFDMQSNIDSLEKKLEITLKQIDYINNVAKK